MTGRRERDEIRKVVEVTQTGKPPRNHLKREGGLKTMI